MEKVRRYSGFFSKRYVDKRGKFILIGLTVGLILAITTATQAVTIQSDRWLSVDRINGSVELVTYAGSRKQVVIGDRLTTAGDLLTTGPSASARLAVDQQAGFVSMAENSQIQVRSLAITNRGGRITEITVTRGQVRLRVRPLTNPDTRLEIHTPAGISGVRGTDFGVVVQPGGQTGVATLEGSVVASAQGEAVTIAANLQSVITPGEAPTPPAPLRDNPSLFITRLIAIPNSSAARIVGSTDTVNLLEIAGQPKRLSPEGRFDVVVPMAGPGAASTAETTEHRSIPARVITPLGTEQQYALVVP